MLMACVRTSESGIGVTYVSILALPSIAAPGGQPKLPLPFNLPYPACRRPHTRSLSSTKPPPPPSTSAQTQPLTPTHHFIASGRLTNSLRRFVFLICWPAGLILRFHPAQFPLILLSGTLLNQQSRLFLPTHTTRSLPEFPPRSTQIHSFFRLLISPIS